MSDFVGTLIACGCAIMKAMKNTARKSLIAAIAVFGLAALTTPITAQPSPEVLAAAKKRAIAEQQAAEPARARALAEQQAVARALAEQQRVIAKFKADNIAKFKADQAEAAKKIAPLSPEAVAAAKARALAEQEAAKAARARALAAKQAAEAASAKALAYQQAAMDKAKAEQEAKAAKNKPGK